MLYILGSSLVLSTAAATKIQVEDNLQFMLNISVALAQPGRNKSFTSVPMDCTATRRKSFMSRSCLGMNVLLSIKILTPSRILLVVISTNPGG